MNEKEIDIHKMCFFENPNNFDLYHRYTLTEKYENQKNYFYVSETNIKYKSNYYGIILNKKKKKLLNDNNSSINKGIKNIINNKPHKRNRDIIIINDNENEKFEENNDNLLKNNISKLNWCPLCLTDIKYFSKSNKLKHLNNCKKPFI